MTKASRDKGYRGENELVNLLKSYGITAHRVPLSGQQAPYTGDIIINLDGNDITTEVKYRKDNPKRLWDWLDKVPLLALKRNRRGWLIVMRLSNFTRLVHNLYNLHTGGD